LGSGLWPCGEVRGQTRPPTAADNGAVVLMYHRFDQPDQPQTNIRMDQFAEHLAELKSGGYTVMALPVILDRLRNRERLPDRTVAITVNDATADLYRLAWPKFRASGFPITVFVASDSVDRGASDMMTWDQVRELAAAGVTIGSQTASVAHLPEIEIDQVKLEIDRASNRIQAETGRRPTLLAYPYGEFGSAVQKVVAERGYAAAFGQQSGVMNPASDRYGLPRFALNETYGGIDRFRLVVNALPLPVTDRVPADLMVQQNPPPFGFTVGPGVGSTENIDCYASDVGRTRIERLGDRVEVRLSAPFPPAQAWCS
jgi:poly-beta-1,6-N-acetyl-D-glucosamine N-deacetylase